MRNKQTFDAQQRQRQQELAALGVGFDQPLPAAPSGLIICPTETSWMRFNDGACGYELYAELANRGRRELRIAQLELECEFDDWPDLVSQDNHSQLKAELGVAADVPLLNYYWERPKYVLRPGQSVRGFFLGYAQHRLRPQPVAGRRYAMELRLTDSQGASVQQRFLLRATPLPRLPGQCPFWPPVGCRADGVYEVQPPAPLPTATRSAG
jgi:hypothetical protein